MSQRLRGIFALDLRALAALRIGLGIAVLLLVASFAQDWRSLFAEDGVISLAVAASVAGPEAVPFLLPFRLAPTLFAPVLLVAMSVLALALALGVCTRIAGAGCWLGLVCLQTRNPHVWDYDDDLLARVLFWSVFLPLAARFSLAARRAGSAPRVANPTLSAASAALLIQVAAVYLFAGLGKTGADWQQDGTALRYVMEHNFWGTRFSAWLLDFPRLMEFASRITPPFEIAVGLALFSPVATAAVRTLAVAMIVAFQVTLGLFIELGAAPFVSSVIAMGLLPGAFWDRLAALAPSSRSAGQPASSAPAAPSDDAPAKWNVAQWALAPAAALMGVFTVAGLTGWAALVPVPVQRLGERLHLTQEWEMYAPVPAHFDGWIRAPGYLASGETVDLVRNGAPSSLLPPDSLPWAGTDFRMSIFRESVRDHLVLLGNDYGRWLCREWNRNHGGLERLVRLEFIWVHVDLSHGLRARPTHNWLIRRRCDAQVE